MKKFISVYLSEVSGSRWFKERLSGSIRKSKDGSNIILDYDNDDEEFRYKRVKNKKTVWIFSDNEIHSTINQIVGTEAQYLIISRYSNGEVTVELLYVEKKEKKLC